MDIASVVILILLVLLVAAGLSHHYREFLDKKIDALKKARETAAKNHRI